MAGSPSTCTAEAARCSAASSSVVETRIAQGVLVPGDAVAVDFGEPSRHLLDPQRDAHRAQLVLVPLEGPPERACSRG